MDSLDYKKTFICKSIIGPYNGPYAKEIVTYLLYDNLGNKIAWHSGPNRPLKCKVNDCIFGIIVRNNVVDYKKSKPFIKKNQLSLFEI